MSSTHNDKSYFDWQSSLGAFGAEVNAFLVERYVRPNHRAYCTPSLSQVKIVARKPVAAH